MSKTQMEADAENWEAISGAVKKLKSLLLAFENKWNDREKQFRPLEI